jgi:hypothetical protein
MARVSLILLTKTGSRTEMARSHFVLGSTVHGTCDDAQRLGEKWISDGPPNTRTFRWEVIDRAE